MNAPLSGRALWLAWLIVILGTAWIAANVAAEIVRIWVPIGDFGQGVDYNGKLGDGTVWCVKDCTVDLWETENPERVRVVSGTALGGELAVLFRHLSGSPIPLRAVTENPEFPKRVTHAGRLAAAMLTAALAVLLFWRRRTRGSFGFFLFTLGFAPGSQTALTADITAPWFATAQNVLNDITEGAGIYGLLMFCESFGRTVMLRWRYLVAALAVAGAGFGAYTDVNLAWWGHPSPYWVIGQIALTFGIAIALIAIFWAYQTIDKDKLAQGHWILAGAAIGIGLYLLGYLGDNAPDFPQIHPDYLRDLLYLGTTVFCAAVVYAELRHHVMNIGFFFSMSLFYTVLIFVGFNLLSMGGSAVKDLSFGAPIAVLLAVCFQPLRNAAEAFVREHLLKRRGARLRALRENVRNVGTELELAGANLALVTGACDALELHGAALVRENKVVAAAGLYSGSEVGLVALARDPRLREKLADQDDVVRLPYERYGVAGVFLDPIYPRVAIVVDVPRIPYQIFIASPHRDGMDVDGAEVASLQEYVRRASVTLAVLALEESPAAR